MTRECRQFNVAVTEFNSMTSAYLESYCRDLVPDLVLRFVTFENNDFHSRNVTIILYNYIPDSIFFFVEHPLDVESALDELALFNPGIEWYWVTLNYIKIDSIENLRIRVELSLSKIPMRVRLNSAFVYK